MLVQPDPVTAGVKLVLELREAFSNVRLKRHAIPILLTIELTVHTRNFADVAGPQLLA
jgi:hypothetical protein